VPHHLTATDGQKRRLVWGIVWHRFVSAMNDGFVSGSDSMSIRCNIVL